MTDTELLDALTAGEWQILYTRGVGPLYPPWGVEAPYRPSRNLSENHVLYYKIGIGHTPREALEMAVKNTGRSDD